MTRFLSLMPILGPSLAQLEGQIVAVAKLMTLGVGLVHTHTHALSLSLSVSQTFHCKARKNLFLPTCCCSWVLKALHSPPTHPATPTTTPPKAASAVKMVKLPHAACSSVWKKSRHFGYVRLVGEGGVGVAFFSGGINGAIFIVR